MKTNFCPKYYFYFHQNMLVIFDHHYTKGTFQKSIFGIRLGWEGSEERKEQNSLNGGSIIIYLSFSK